MSTSPRGRDPDHDPDHDPDRDPDPARGLLDPIAVMRQLIAIDSVNPDLVPGAPGEREIADWCAEWLGAHGFTVHRLEGRLGRPSVVGIAPGTGGGRSLMLNGHLDTVGVAGYGTHAPVGAGDRITDPFAGDERDGNIYGRGAFDMKGGLAAILVAAARAAGAGRAADSARPGLAGDVLVALVADEEVGSLGTEQVLRSFRADAAIVAEPSGLELTLAHRGFAWFELELSGRAAHGALPEQGVDAIAHAGLVLRALDDLRARLESGPVHPALGHGTVRVSMISGGEDAATVASTCTLAIERRTLPGQATDAVEAELRSVLDELSRVVPEFRFRLTRLVARGGFEADQEWPIVRTVGANVERVLGRPAATRGEPFWTDAGLLLEAGIPCLLLGVEGGGAHADLEWASAASVHRLADILTGTIQEFCA